MSPFHHKDRGRPFELERDMKHEAVTSIESKSHNLKLSNGLFVLHEERIGLSNKR